MALLAGLFGVIADAVQPAPPRPAADLAGEVIIMRFEGNPAPPYVLRTLRERRAAGVILFRDNAPSPEATTALTRTIAKADPQALIATDQEGGTIRILGWAPPAQDQYLVTDAAAHAREAARALSDHGINLNLAPVADRADPGSVMDARAYATGTAETARKVGAAVRAYKGTGVRPTAKHFPGLGATDGNTDKVRVTIERPAATIGRSDLPPFQAAINAGVPAIMLSHAIYPSLDRGTIASQSKPIVTGLLKQRMGFEGVAMTDSLEAFSVRSRMTMEQAAVRSIRAGIDAVLTTGQGTHIRVIRALTREARRDPAFHARLQDAANRVAALRSAR